MTDQTTTAAAAESTGEDRDLTRMSHPDAPQNEVAVAPEQVPLMRSAGWVDVTEQDEAAEPNGDQPDGNPSGDQAPVSEAGSPSSAAAPQDAGTSPTEADSSADQQDPSTSTRRRRLSDTPQA